MPRVYESIKCYFKLPKIIHIVGTNGKGTTGRFLASALHTLGYRVGHYTSPHILNFNERVWINSCDVKDDSLDEAHKKLLKLLTQEDADSLSYFEYTTLLAMQMYQGLEYVVLEAGLGGENDATAVFEKSLTLVTPIDKDHELFLGKSIKEIATAKLNAIQNFAILAEQKHSEVYEIADKISQTKSLDIFHMNDVLQEQDREKIINISTSLALEKYLEENLKLAISALGFFNIKYSENSFEEARLFGRLTRLRKNIIIDIGHNTLAASAILESLLGKKYILVYNSFKDKNYEEILKILKPIILHVEIIELDNSRIVPLSLLKDTITKLDIEYKTFELTQERENYLVFGSFSVVKEFLRSLNE